MSSDDDTTFNKFSSFITTPVVHVWTNWLILMLDSIGHIAFIVTIYRSRETENISAIFLYIQILVGAMQLTQGIGDEDHSEWGPAIVVISLGIIPLALKLIIERHIPRHWQRLRRVIADQCRYFSERNDIISLANTIRGAINSVQHRSKIPRAAYNGTEKTTPDIQMIEKTQSLAGMPRVQLSSNLDSKIPKIAIVKSYDSSDTPPQTMLRSVASMLRSKRANNDTINNSNVSEHVIRFNGTDCVIEKQ